MLIIRHGFRMFQDSDLDATLKAQLANIEKTIKDSQGIDCENVKSNLPELVEKFTISPLVLEKDKLVTGMEKAMIPAERFPNSFAIDRGEAYEKPVAVFRLPFSGEIDLLKLRPSTFMIWSDDVAVEGNEIVFESIVFKEDAAAIKKDRDDFINNLESQINNINEQVNDFNNNLESVIEQIVEDACKDRQKETDLLSELNS